MRLVQSETNEVQSQTNEVQSETNEWISQLRIAAQNKQPSVIKELIEQKRRITYHESIELISILGLIILNDDVESLKSVLLSPKRSQMNFELYKLLEFAVTNKRGAAVAFLLNSKFTNYKTFNRSQGLTLLIIAAEQDDLNLCKALLEAGAKPCSRSRSPILIAARKGNVEIVRYLLLTLEPAAQRLWGFKALEVAGLEVANYLLNESPVRETLCKKIQDQGDLLSAAVVKGNLEVVIFLRKAGANLGERPLELAARKGQEAIVKWLLDFNESQHPFNREEVREAIFSAVERGYLNCVKAIVDTVGFDFLIGDDVATLFGKAVKNEYEALIDYFIKAHETKREEGRNLLEKTQIYEAIYSATESGFLDCVKILNRYFESSCPKAVGHEDKKISPTEKGLFTIYEGGSTLLIVAAQRFHSEIVAYLLKTLKDNEKDPQVILDYLNHQLPTGETALYFAAANGDWSSVQELIQAGAISSTVCSDGSTPLMAAVRNEQPLVVAELLNGVICEEIINRGAEGYSYKIIKRRPTEEEFAGVRQGLLIIFEKKYLWWIHFRNNRNEVCKSLIEDEECLSNLNDLALGVYEEKMIEDENQKIFLEEIMTFYSVKAVKKGETAAYRAAKDGEVGCLEKLLKAGADLFFPCADGTTPLIAAAQNQTSTVLRFLLDQPNVLSKVCAEFKNGVSLGATLLYLSVEHRHRDCIYPLLQTGACPNVCDDDRRTPLDMALEFPEYGTVILLLLYGAAEKRRWLLYGEKLVAAFKEQALLHQDEDFRERCIHFLDTIKMKPKSLLYEIFSKKLDILREDLIGQFRFTEHLCSVGLFLKKENQDTNNFRRAFQSPRG